ncbi:MAG: leucine-rich repeat domain-containing protein, partial [Planctomycetia bacterium]
ILLGELSWHRQAWAGTGHHLGHPHNGTVPQRTAPRIRTSVQIQELLPLRGCGSGWFPSRVNSAVTRLTDVPLADVSFVATKIQVGPLRHKIEPMPIRSGCTATILLSCTVTLLLAMPSACNRREPTVEHTLEFPAGHSLGRLWIVEESPSFLSGSGEIAKGDARGRLRIAVPAGWHLELRVSAEGATDLSGLSRLKADDLRGLSFHGTPVADDDLRHVAPLTGLRFLDFSNTKIAGAGFAHLKGLGEFTILDLTGSATTDAGLAGLDHCSGLRSLSVSKTAVGDAGLVSVGRLKELEKLELYYTKVGDAGLAEVGHLTKLESLDLGFTQVTDAGLSHVAGLPKLRWLRLDSTAVSDEGLRKLRALPSLHEISLNDTAVTAAAVTAFGQARPQCVIDANRLDMRKLFPSRYAR